MNIFYLDHDVRECAKMHNDKHVVKMIIEYAQLMSTAHRILDGEEYYDLTANGRRIKRWRLPDGREDVLMKASHINHPSAVWVRQSKQNYVWLMQMWCCLLQEYTYRYGKNHACGRLVGDLAEIPHNLPEKPFTEPTPAMPEDVKIPGNSIASYRNYYINNKTHLASWKGKVNSRPIPKWYSEGCLQKLTDINQELGFYA